MLDEHEPVHDFARREVSHLHMAEVKSTPRVQTRLTYESWWPYRFLVRLLANAALHSQHDAASAQSLAHTELDCLGKARTKSKNAHTHTHMHAQHTVDAR